MEQILSNEFEEKVLNSDKKVLVDFFATWCGPCKMLSPILEQLYEEVKDEWEIIKMDIDECEDLARQFGIMSIPTLLMFKDGALVKKEVGLRNKNQLLEMLKEVE